jgi:hypothetical protein
VRDKEVTGLLHVSDRLLAGELSRVEAARGTLHPLPDKTKDLIIANSLFKFLTNNNSENIIKSATYQFNNLY